MIKMDERCAMVYFEGWMSGQYFGFESFLDTIDKSLKNLCIYISLSFNTKIFILRFFTVWFFQTLGYILQYYYKKVNAIMHM